MSFAILHHHKLIKLNKFSKQIFFLIILFYLTFYIGYRDNVGGDWGTYYENYYIYLDIPIVDFIKNHILDKDALFKLISYIFVKFKFGFHNLNLFFALIFSFFLINFSFRNKRPFLILLLSMPYLVNVVSMGYHRQALALSLFLFSFKYLEEMKLSKYIFSIFIAASFHFSSSILFLLIFIKKNKIIAFSGFILILFTILIYFNLEFVSHLIRNYLLAGYTSSGSIIRSIMNLVPSLIYLIFRKKFILIIKNDDLFFLLSLISIFFFVFSLFPAISVIVDRLSLYLIPFQIIVFANFIDLFKKENNSNTIYFYSLITLYYLVLLVWAYFGTHSLWWFPYKNILFN